ncbi:hypothetical protein V8D89_007370 [Ganoderma adspersum]
MRHARFRSHSKLSTRVQSSSRILRACIKRQEKKYKPRSLPRPSACPAPDVVDVGVLSPSSQRRSSNNHPTTLLVPALDKGLAERDNANCHVNVDNDPSSSHSLHEELEAFIEDAVAQSHDDEDVSEAEVDRMLSSPSSLSSTPLHLFESSPRASTVHAPSPGDGLPDDFSPLSSSLQHDIDPLKPPEERGGDTEGMLISRSDYMVEPVEPRREGGIVTKMLSSDPFNGLTDLALSFGCPELRGGDDNQNQVRPRDAVIETMRRLAAVLGRHPSGLKVRAPWPELTFPCIPNVLKVILDNFPGLERLHFADLQCGCGDCESLYTDDVKFKQLQVSALAHRVSGPLRSTGSLRVTIERKSMHSVGKDYTKYIGDDANHLVDEVRYGSSTSLPQNEGRTSATARSQDEAQFFIKLLKRGLPSATHFSVVNPDLRVTYTVLDLSPDALLPSCTRTRTSKSPAARTEGRKPAPPPCSRSQTPFHRESSFASSCTGSASGYTPPRDAGLAISLEDPSFDLSGDICPQDGIPDEPGQEMVEAAISAEGHESTTQAIQLDNPGDADLTFRSGVESTVDDADVHWWTQFRSPQEPEGDFDGHHGYGSGSGLGGIYTDVAPLFSPFLSPSPSSQLVASMLGTLDVSAGPCISGVYNPGQGWADSDGFDFGRPQADILLESPVNRGSPPPCFQLDRSADVVSKEFCPKTAQDGGWTWPQPALGSMLPGHAGLSAHQEDSDPPSCGYPDLEHLYFDTSLSFGENRESDSGASVDNVSVGVLGDTAQVSGIQRGLGLEGDTVMISHETVLMD